MASRGTQHTAQLLDAARRGDVSAQTQLMQAYSSYLTLIARLQVNRQFHGRFSASDVVQDVLLRARERMGEFRGTTEPEFLAWLRRILASRLVSLARYHLAGVRDVRRERRLNDAVDQSSLDIAQRLAGPGDAPSERASQHEQGVLLAEALDQLPADYREVLVMRHLEGKSFAEIAQTMSRTIPSIKSLWTRAVTKLRTRLSEDDPS
jgi:RNA polymerase sigma-70 factor (ECF subfamily)